MTLQAEVLDGRVNVYRWNTATLTWVAWDGAVTGGSASGAGSATTTSVNDSATSVTLLSANASRLGVAFYNTSTALLYIKCGATATTSPGGYLLPIAAGGYFEMPFNYTGRIDGIWASDAGGAVSVTEFTA